jgi:hypothetical protein
MQLIPQTLKNFYLIMQLSSVMKYRYDVHPHNKPPGITRSGV